MTSGRAAGSVNRKPITNSYNGSRALRLDIGFLREHCANGVIFEEKAATFRADHTRAGMRTLRTARPFAGMADLCERFRRTLAVVRGVEVTRGQAKQLVRAVTGWPVLGEHPTDVERADQALLDADLARRVDVYLRELGDNAYAVFNAMTDIAARPPASRRFRRDRPTLERRAGMWLRDITTAASEPGFSMARHMAGVATDPAASNRPPARPWPAVRGAA